LIRQKERLAWQGRSDGGIWVYIPQISPSKLLMG